MQTTEEKVDTSKALDASLVDIESSGTESQEQDTSNRPGNDAHANDADIRPIYDEELMAKVQSTAEINIFTTGQQHTEQPEFNNEGEVDQNAEKCHDTCPLPAKLTDNQITEHSYQSLKSENICVKKTIAQFQNDFLRMEAHCVNLKLKYQNQALKEGQHGQFSKVKSNEAKIKHDIYVIETINIKLKHKVAILLKENEALKRETESTVVKPHHMIASSESRNSSKNMPRFSSNDMVHNHYLEEAKKRHKNAKCVFNANHDSCVTKFLNEVNSRAKVPSNKITNRNKPVERISVAKKQKRQISKGHRFLIKKTFVVHEKTMTPRSCLRWKPTGKISKTAGLRWVPTGKIFTSSTTKVDSEPPDGQIQISLTYMNANKLLMSVQSIPPAHVADSTSIVLTEWNAVYDAYNEVACLMLKSMTPKLHRQFENYTPYEMLQELKSMFKKQTGVESVGLILNGLTSDFAGFVRNYNMHNMGKTIGEQHDMLIEYEKGLPKKTETSQGLRGARNLEQGALYLYVVSKNDALYFNAILHDGIYEIDMHNLVPNVKSIYNVSNKRAKHNLDSTYLWHCRLAHITKKRKMTRKSFPYHTERATDLLGIIHTDVCGPLRHVSRQGASYFITFMDDYSRFGYVYLLKHKHEVFETFKVFKNEVENQLGKTIKALRSDRGGEYISQEFKDYLKAYMVRSMMNLTTLPLSFWDYALESTTRILNMVLTKKIDKTSYELWYGKVSNLSYLKKVSGRTIDLKEIQDEDTSPSEITSEILMEVKGFKPPQEEVISIHTPERTHRAPNRLCLSVKADSHIYRAFYDYEIWKMDVKTAFLNGYLDKDIYMVQPEGFFDPKHSRKLCKLQRSIYGLKQASRSWNKRFDEEIKKDRSKRLIRLSQSAYMDKILKRYRMDNSTRGHIPMKERLDLNKTQGSSTPEKVKSMQNVPYASVVGYIMHAVKCTRPDVAFAQNITSHLQQNPGVPHWIVVKNILKGDIKYQTGYVFVLNGGAVDWKSSKQRLGIVPTINKHIKMFCDNVATLLIANEPGVQKGARHYHRRYHYVRECIELGKINLLKVHIDDNLADPFTKALPKGKLTQYARSIGLCLASSFKWICVLVFR
nr:hypothetical protein [Tanacetum cinerariifolium]